MLLLLLLSVFLLCFYNMRIRLNGFHEDYLSKSRTNAIKGFFILLIVLSHSIGYLKDSSYAFNRFGDQYFCLFFNLISQLVVVMFLFYSGYGVSESFKTKGLPYLQSFPRKRILTTLLNFDVAVLVFIVLSLCLGISIPFKVGLLSLTGWESVGNSNWYIFVILLCYVFSYLVLRIPLHHRAYRVALLFVLSFLLILVLSRYQGDYWYNTIMSYPMGFLFSTYKDRFQTVFKKYYWLIVILLLLIFKLLYFYPNGTLYLPYNIASMAFALLCVLLTMKVDINSPVLQWFGSHLFPVYIYMRVPMMFIENRYPELIATQPAIFIVLCLVVTSIIAHFYRFWQIKL